MRKRELIVVEGTVTVYLCAENPKEFVRLCSMFSKRAPESVKICSRL